MLAVLYHVNKNGSFAGRTVDLVKALHEVKKSGQISEAESIPVFTNFSVDVFGGWSMFSEATALP